MRADSAEGHRVPRDDRELTGVIPLSVGRRRAAPCRRRDRRRRAGPASRTRRPAHSLAVVRSRLRTSSRRPWRDRLRRGTPGRRIRDEADPREPSRRLPDAATGGAAHGFPRDTATARRPRPLRPPPVPVRAARRRAARASSARARIWAASTAAFLAPALPTATVATGMPPGICTVESRASRPSARPPGSGHADHRADGLGRDDAGEVRRHAGAADEHPDACRPQPSRTKSRVRSRVRCAELTCATQATPRRSSSARCLAHDVPVAGATP